LGNEKGPKERRKSTVGKNPPITTERKRVKGGMLSQHKYLSPHTNLIIFRPELLHSQTLLSAVERGVED
jgi:hypothetical protein